MGMCDNITFTYKNIGDGDNKEYCTLGNWMEH